MFYGLHEKIDQTGDNKVDIMRKNLESHIDVSSRKYYVLREKRCIDSHINICTLE